MIPASLPIHHFASAHCSVLHSTPKINTSDASATVSSGLVAGTVWYDSAFPWRKDFAVAGFLGEPTLSNRLAQATLFKWSAAGFYCLSGDAKLELLYCAPVRPRCCSVRIVPMFQCFHVVGPLQNQTTDTTDQAMGNKIEFKLPSVCASMSGFGMRTIGNIGSKVVIHG